MCVELWPEFLQKIDYTIFHDLQLPLYIVWIFLKFGEVIVEYFTDKSLFGFSPFCLHYLFMKLFLLHSKTKNTVKDKNQNFTSIKLNDKKSEHSLAKKVICECLAPYWFLLTFNGKLDLLKVKHEFTWKQQLYQAQTFWWKLLIR